MRAALLVLCLLLAGCGGGGAPVQACEEDVCEAVVSDAEARAMQGVVVDEAVVPVAGAVVRLFQGDERLAEVTTAANGVFTLRGLNDGFYRLVADHEAFAATETQLDWSDAAPDWTRIQITREPTPVPIHRLMKWDGFIACGISTVAGGHTGACPHAAVSGATDDHERVFYEEVLGDRPDWAQIEVYWQSNQMYSDNLRVSVWMADAQGASGTPQTVAGDSVLSLSWDQQAILDNGIARATNTSNAKGFHVAVDPGDPALSNLAIVYEQRFTAYVSLMYQLTPPEGWMFVTHGALT